MFIKALHCVVKVVMSSFNEFPAIIRYALLYSVICTSAVLLDKLM